MQISVYGKASGRTKEIEVDHSQMDVDLLSLLTALGFPIASSCSGEGVCKKCVIQNEWLTCKLTLREFLANEPSGIIKISYL